MEITKEVEGRIDVASKRLDDEFNFKEIIGGIGGQAVEWFDKRIFSYALTFLYSVLTEEYEELFDAMLTAISNWSLEGIDDAVANRLNDLIDIPYLDDTKEGLFFKNVITVIIDVIANYLDEEDA